MQESPYFSPAGLCRQIDLHSHLICNVSHHDLSNNRAIVINMSLGQFISQVNGAKVQILHCFSYFNVFFFSYIAQLIH